jgi:hypothetical protein
LYASRSGPVVRVKSMMLDDKQIARLKELTKLIVAEEDSERRESLAAELSSLLDEEKREDRASQAQERAD